MTRKFYSQPIFLVANLDERERIKSDEGEAEEHRSRERSDPERCDESGAKSPAGASVSERPQATERSVRAVGASRERSDRLLLCWALALQSKRRKDFDEGVTQKQGLKKTDLCFYLTFLFFMG